MSTWTGLSQLPPSEEGQSELQDGIIPSGSPCSGWAGAPVLAGLGSKEPGCQEAWAPERGQLVFSRSGRVVNWINKGVPAASILWGTPGTAWHALPAGWG